MVNWELMIEGYVSGTVCSVVIIGLLPFIGFWAIPIGVFVGVAAFIGVRHLLQNNVII